MQLMVCNELVEDRMVLSPFFPNRSDRLFLFRLPGGCAKSGGSGCYVVSATVQPHTCTVVRAFPTVEFPPGWNVCERAANTCIFGIDTALPSVHGF